MESTASPESPGSPEAPGSSGSLEFPVSPEFAGEIDLKSIPAEAPGLPKSSQNRSRSPLGTPRGTQERSGGLSGAAWEHAGSVLARPRRAPGAHGDPPRTPWEARKSARGRPGARRGNQNRRAVASGNKKIDFPSCGSCAKRHWADFSPIFVELLYFCNISEPLKVPRLPAKTKVRAFTLRVESLM